MMYLLVLKVWEWGVGCEEQVPAELKCMLLAELKCVLLRNRTLVFAMKDLQPF